MSDAFQAQPGLLFAMVLVQILGPSIWSVGVAVGLHGIPGANRFVRSSALAAAATD